MTGKEIMQLAWEGKPQPENLHQPEQLLYQTVKLIKWHSEMGLPEEQAIAEKAAALRAYEAEKHEYKYAEQMQCLWNKISVYFGAYALNPCEKTAEEFVRAVYGLPENWRKNPEIVKSWERKGNTT